jgi:hypothetical protein
MTTADVPELMEKTRTLMLDTLKELSASRKAADESTVPLLKDQRSDNYDTISAQAPLEGAVAGASDPDSTRSVDGNIEERNVDDALGGTSGKATTRSQTRGGKKSIA